MPWWEVWAYFHLRWTVLQGLRRPHQPLDSFWCCSGGSHRYYDMCLQHLENAKTATPITTTNGSQTNTDDHKMMTGWCQENCEKNRMMTLWIKFKTIRAGNKGLDIKYGPGFDVILAWTFRLRFSTLTRSVHLHWPGVRVCLKLDPDLI